MEINTNLDKVLTRAHEKKWVALSPNRSTVLGFSDSLLELKNKVGNKDALYMKVLSGDTSFAF